MAFAKDAIESNNSIASTPFTSLTSFYIDFSFPYSYSFITGSCQSQVQKEGVPYEN